MKVLFDTLKYANQLKAAGVPEKQAEVQAKAFAELMESKLATKHDLALVKHDIKLINKDLHALEINLEKKFDFKMLKLKNELIKWVLGVSAGQAAVILACIQFTH